MTEFEIASSIEKYVTSHEGVTDFPISYAQITDEVDTLRIRTIEEIDKNRLLVAPYNLMSQTIEFKKADVKMSSSGKPYVECPPIVAHETGNMAISYVGSTDTMKQWRIVEGRQIKYALESRWLKTEPIAHFQDARIYIPQACNFSLRAIFQRPRDLEIYGYNPEIDSYPLSNGKIDIIIGKTAESYIRTLYRVRPQPNQQVDLPQGNA